MEADRCLHNPIRLTIDTLDLMLPNYSLKLSLSDDFYQLFCKDV